MAKRKVIIDTDAGVDDTQALVVCLTSPSVDVIGISCVGGNTSVGNVAHNVCRTLAVLKREDVPVFVGSDLPLMMSAAGTEGPQRAPEWHGDDGLGDAAFDWEPSMAPVVGGEHAANAIVRLVKESPGEVTLLALGPHTNVAIALNLDPGLADTVAAFMFMGGTYHAKGNKTAAAEFNIAADVEAAAICSARFPQATMVTWELTLDFALDFGFVEGEWMDDSHPTAAYVRTVSQQLIDKSKTFGGTLAIPDVLAAAVICDPSVVLESKKRHVAVETAGRLTRGMTVVNWDNIPAPGGEVPVPNTDIVMKLDVAKLRDMLKASTH